MKKLILTLIALTLGIGISQVPEKDANSNLENSMSKPKVIIFDVNETLLDLAPLKTSVGKALGGRDEFLPLWFSTMILGTDSDETPLEFTAIFILEIKDGKIAHNWVERSAFELYQRLTTKP